MSMTPHEIDTLADALAERVAALLGGRSDADALVDCHAAAALLGCSVPTVERLTRTGEIPSLKVGRLRRYRRADLIGRRNDKGGSDHAK
jgi:excisionase family DNA binding protein